MLFGVPAFWIWLIFGVCLLALELFIGTQWLLWLAAAAGVVAVICLTPLPFSFLWQVVVFAAIGLALVLATRRLLSRPELGADINDPNLRLVGRQGHVLSGFAEQEGEREGRIIIDGVEWPAVLSGDKPVMPDTPVVITGLGAGRLLVRLAD